MVTPLPFVIQADALLLLTTGFDHCAVALDNRQVEETVGVLLPDLQPRFMKSVHQILNLPFTEPSAEVPRRCGIGNALSSQGIEIRFIVASQFEMLQAGSSGEPVESNVEDMIGFGIRHMKFKNWTAAIDAVSNTELPDHLLRDTNSAR
jgi:hypothetical protein